MHVAFGRVRRKSRIVADYADYADYRVRDGGRWLVIGCWVSLRSTWGKHPSKNTRSYSKSGDREHSSLLQQEWGSRAQLAPTARGAWGITELNTETSYSLWYICGTEDNCLNRDLQDFRIYRIEESGLETPPTIALLRTGGQPL